MLELETSNSTKIFLAENKIKRLNTIKEQIEKMEKNNHISALYMISQNKYIKYSENSNGIFINLTELPDDMINRLEDFIVYINKQKKDIDDIEIKKCDLENIYFKGSNSFP